MERRALERIAFHLAAIVDSAEDAIASKDINGVVQTWNRAAERMFGYSAEEAIGKPITLIIPPALQDEERLIIQKVGAGERIEHFETTRARKDGRLLPISLTISPIRDQHGRIIGASKIARDAIASDELAAAQKGVHRPDSGALAGEVAAALRAGDVLAIKGSLGSKMKVIVDAVLAASGGEARL